MIRDLLSAAVALGVGIQVAGPSAPPPQPPANATSANQTASAPSSLDPAAVVFTTGAGLVLHAVKPGSVADYEAAIVALQDALAKTDDPHARQVAGSWRVYRAAETDAKSNAIYVHVLQPAVSGVDYRPSLWLDDLLAGAPAELLAKYRDAFAAAPTKLSLVEFADMNVAPAPSNATPPGPINTSPPGPRPR